ELQETDAEIVLSACSESLTSRSGEDDGPELLALGALAEAAFEALTPSMSAALPVCLGLDLAGATTVAYEDGGLGTGWQHTVVRAPLLAPVPWWQFASGRLVVPYSVGVTAEGHGCVPEEPLPVAISASVPTVDSDWALLLNQQVVARQVAATWKAGGLCGDRLGGAATWVAADLTTGWEAWEGLDEAMAVRARVWPESPPELIFTSEHARSHVQAHVDAGTWRVEFMGWRDGARVRLATVGAAISIRASVVVEPTGELWLSTEAIDVGVIETEAGLLSPPSDEVLAGHVESVVRGVLEAAPLWALPPIPTGVTPTVELHGAFLVIRDA
ncbi:MAG: hypothetical protein QF464_08515, partial [Myxococcota bacterium]|nr:hypothetical protein [Myxococcota bacterium]